VKDFFWLIYLFPIRWLAGVLPPERFVQGGMLLEPFCQILTGNSRKRMETILGRALGLTRQASSVIARRFVRSTLRRVLDDHVINRLAASGEWLCEEMRGLDVLDMALAKGKGVVLVTGHFHASRLAKRYLAALGYPVLSIRNGDPPDPAAGVFGRKYLQQRYVRLLNGVIRDEVMLQDPELTLKVMQRLRAGGIVNIHIDTFYSADTLTLPLLGFPWEFPVGFLRIARACGSALIPMFCRGNSSGFSITFEPEFPLEDAGDAEEFASRNLNGLTRYLEDQVRSQPDEWDLWTWI
jgi:KDO2-lipid IV(A) lauroyltransferase